MNIAQIVAPRAQGFFFTAKPFGVKAPSKRRNLNVRPFFGALPSHSPNNTPFLPHSCGLFFGACPLYAVFFSMTRAPLAHSALRQDGLDMSLSPSWALDILSSAWRPFIPCPRPMSQEVLFAPGEAGRQIAYEFYSSRTAFNSALIAIFWPVRWLARGVQQKNGALISKVRHFNAQFRTIIQSQNSYKGTKTFFVFICNLSAKLEAFWAPRFFRAMIPQRFFCFFSTPNFPYDFAFRAFFVVPSHGLGFFLVRKQRKRRHNGRSLSERAHTKRKCVREGSHGRLLPQRSPRRAHVR